MTIEIKEGRYYRDRMGQVHGPMVHCSIANWPWTTPDRQRNWTAKGYVYFEGVYESRGDLIEEVRIVPVDDEGSDP